MTKIEKSGMLMNADKEVVGWVNAGDEVDLKEGDLVVSHPKTAEKHGVAEQFATMKAENAPKKERKAKTSTDGAKRTRSVCPRTGTYVVVKPDAAQLKEGETATVRNEILGKLLNGTSFDAFWADAPDTFEHPARSGEMKSFATSGLVNYAISRGMIEVAA